jgi:hypothetical protein
MPELTWTTALAWWGVIAGALTVAGVILRLVAGRPWAPTLATLRADQASLRQISAHQATLRQILARIERHEEPRC